MHRIQLSPGRLSDSPLGRSNFTLRGLKCYSYLVIITLSRLIILLRNDFSVSELRYRVTVLSGSLLHYDFSPPLLSRKRATWLARREFQQLDSQEITIALGIVLLVVVVVVARSLVRNARKSRYTGTPSIMNDDDDVDNNRDDRVTR